MHKRVFRVDLIGTRLGDYAYVTASTGTAAKKVVHRKLLAMHSGVKEYMPSLQVKESSLETAIQDFSGETSCTPESIDKSVRGLKLGVPLFDFEDFDPDFQEEV